MPLPFDRQASVTDLSGTVISAGVWCSPIWPTEGGPVELPTGVRYDHSAQAERGAFDALAGANRRLVVDGVVYGIAKATRHDYLPHVDLRLLRVKGS